MQPVVGPTERAIPTIASARFFLKVCLSMVVCPCMFLFLSFSNMSAAQPLGVTVRSGAVDPAQLMTLTGICFPSEVIVDGGKISIPRRAGILGC